MTKRILFVGGSSETVPAMARAKQIGYYVFCSDYNPDAPGMQWAARHGAGWGIASTYDPDETLEVAKKWKLDGVVAVACDVALTVSRVAAALELPGVLPLHAMLSQDKIELKKWLDQVFIPTPGHPAADADTWLVKPADSRGGRGVYRVTGIPPRLGSEWIEKARQYSPTGRVLLERWVPGPQVSAECIVWDLDVVHCCFSDRNYAQSLYPNLIEDGGNSPSRYESDALRELVQKTAERLGIRRGSLKFDLVLDEENDGRPTVIEMAIGRMGPSVSTFWWSAGVDFVAAALAVACGENPAPELAPVLPARAIAARCELPGEPTNSNHHGRYFWAVADGWQEAVKKAEAKRDKYFSG